MNTVGLTKQQARALEFIDESQRTCGLSPTLKEIAAAIGVRSQGGARRVVSELRDRGRIQWKPRLPRSIVLIPDDRSTHVLPPDLQVRLEQFCFEHDERPDDVLADALALHFDALEFPESKREGIRE